MTEPRAGVRQFRGAVGLALAASPVAVLASLAVAVVTGLAPVAVAWLTKTVLDRITEPDGLDPRLTGLAVGLAVLGVCVAAAPNVERYLSAEVQRSVGILARDRMFAALERLRGLRRLEDPRFQDRLHLGSDAGRTSPPVVLSGAVELVSGALVIVGFTATLLAIGPVVTVVVLLGAIPVGVAEFTLARQRARMLWHTEPAQRREMFYAQLLSTPRAAKEIRLFGLSRFLRGRMVAELTTIYRAERGVDRRELRVQGLLAVLSAGIAGYGLVWVVAAAAAGTVSVGDVAVFVAAVAGIQSALAVTVDQGARTHEALLMFDHYLHVTSVTDDLTPGSGGGSPVPQLRTAIQLHDVWFRYSATHPWILRGVSLTIPAGQSTAIVGHNGAGKSTIVKLLCRLYDPDRGRITWDGTDLRDLDLDALRARISTVFQDHMDYDLTAEENIALGDLDALGDEPRLRAAAERAGAHDFLTALPHGYRTMLSRIFTDSEDRDDPGTGVVLSGGQLQRLAIARALLRDDPDLLVLDEPSSGLDAEAEHDIHTTLGAHRAGRTSVLISHRLGTIRDADTIAVLAGGRVAELGGHHELIAARGTYRRLFSLQAKGYEEAPVP